MNDLDLSALADGPVPPLAAPADVRARGEQRRRRSHALVAGAAALVVAVGAGTAVALVDRGKPDALVPAAPTATPAQAQPAPPQAYLLTPEDAARVAGGSWEAGDVLPDKGLLLYVCPAGEDFEEPGVSRALTRDGGALRNFVSVLPSGDPRRWLTTFRDAALNCPRRAADSEDGRASNTFEVLSSEGMGDALVIRDTYRDCDACRAGVTIWVLVASESVLSVTSLDEPELARLDGWVDAVRSRLADPADDAPTPSPTRSSEPAVVAGPLGPQDLLEMDRIGPVTIGMTLAEAEAAAEQDLRQEGDDLGGCVYYRPRSGEPDVSFMVIRGVVSRIDVDSGTTTTNSGIGIGSSEADVKRTHPSTTVSKHYYTDGNYLRVLSEDGRHAFLFETDGAKVLRFRSGYPGAVDQVEGCA